MMSKQGPGLSVDEARSFYDSFGARQDRQVWYEGPALARLVALSSFDRAQYVLEFGCGTGRFCQELLADQLPADSRVLAIDQSATMVALTRERLQPYADRAMVLQSDGSMTIGEPDHSFDRFVSTYVLDLLSADDAHTLLQEAARLLSAEGMICLCGLGEGKTRLSRVVSNVWRGLHRLRPRVVGGCRPLAIETLLAQQGWKILAAETTQSWGLASEIVVAQPPDQRWARSADRVSGGK